MFTLSIFCSPYPSFAIPVQAPVVEKLDSSFHPINLYPLVSAISLIHGIEIYPMDSTTHLFSNWGQLFKYCLKHEY